MGLTKGENMKKIIGFSLCCALLFAVTVEAKRTDLRVKLKTLEPAQEAVVKDKKVRKDEGRKPAQATNPLLNDTRTPAWADPKDVDRVSCEASTAQYGKTCTSRFLSF